MKISNQKLTVTKPLTHRYFKNLTHSLTEVNSFVNFSKSLDLRFLKQSSKV